MGPSGLDHGGGLDAAIAAHGGARADWLDLSTGINPVPYPLPTLGPDAWTALPDQAALARLISAARSFWGVPEGADILPAPGASALIAALPRLWDAGTVRIDPPTYNEHAAAFENAGWRHADPQADIRVVVHPNNPTGALWDGAGTHRAVIADESFCDVAPDHTTVARAANPNHLVLKSFGKFWGLAGLRLGFLIAAPAHLARLRRMLGPWAVSGPALAVGTAALEDAAWADVTRVRLAQDANRLDAMLEAKGAQVVGGTPLFRLYDVGDAALWHDRLARAHILTRIFPYSDRWIRLGLPGPAGWDRLEAAL